MFRGPQTTSQGANAIAGAIIVNTKNPTFTPEALYQAEIGNYNHKRTSIALSGPLMGEDLAGRLAVDYSARDTFIDYTSPNFQKGKTDQDFSAPWKTPAPPSTRVPGHAWPRPSAKPP